MVAFSFKKQHAAAVESGDKTQTMRKGPQRAKVGDRLQLYTGQRTKACRKLGEAVCIAAIPVRFNPTFFALDNEPLDYDLREVMAIADGFKNWQKLVEFFFPVYWSETDPTNADFVGYLYKWRLDNVS